MFTNDTGDLGSIPGRVIPKTQKMVLDATLPNTQHYKVRIKGKVEQPRERSSALPCPRCSSYRKGSLQVTLDYGRQLYFYIYMQPFFFRHVWLNKTDSFYQYFFLFDPFKSSNELFSIWMEWIQKGAMSPPNRVHLVLVGVILGITKIEMKNPITSCMPAYLSVKINKPSLNKINLKYSGCVLQCL